MKSADANNIVYLAIHPDSNNGRSALNRNWSHIIERVDAGYIFNTPQAAADHLVDTGCPKPTGYLIVEFEIRPDVTYRTGNMLIARRLAGSTVMVDGKIKVVDP